MDKLDYLFLKAKDLKGTKHARTVISNDYNTISFQKKISKSKSTLTWNVTEAKPSLFK